MSSRYTLPVPCATGSLLPVLLLALLAGCSADRPSTPMHADFFSKDDEVPLTTRALHAQSARGARLDAMLHPAHFDGPSLNSLGRDKLSRMLRDPESPLPLTVHVNTHEPAACFPAISHHLADLGLTPDQFFLHSGPNPHALHPSATAISKLSAPTPTPTAPALIPLTPAK